MDKNEVIRAFFGYSGLFEEAFGMVKQRVFRITRSGAHTFVEQSLIESDNLIFRPRIFGPAIEEGQQNGPKVRQSRKAKIQAA